MLSSARSVASLLAACVCFVTTGFLFLLGNSTPLELGAVGFLSFGSAFLFTYFTLEFLVFKEVNNLYTMIEKLKKKDFKLQAKSSSKSKIRPIEMIGHEIYQYVSKKQQEIDELKKLESYRREFLADISHELKNPIHAAQGFIDTLLEGAAKDKEVRDKFLKKAAKSLDGLNNLVQDIITLSLLETGENKMLFEYFRMDLLVKSVFEQLEAKAEQKDIKMKFEGSPAEVFADPNRITQVMTNLVENGIKYGKEGGEVQVIFEDVKEHLLISVADTGLGIAPEHLGRIFERFYRVDKSRSKQNGGSGLGLAIVEHIVMAHGSKVSVTSKLGKGTTFSFKLRKFEKHAEAPKYS